MGTYEVPTLITSLQDDIVVEDGVVSEDDNFNWSSIAHRAEYDINEKLVLAKKIGRENPFTPY